MAIRAKLRELAQVVVASDPLEAHVEVVLDGEHAREIGEVRAKERGEGLGAMDEGEEQIDREDLRAAQMIRREALKGRAVPEDAAAREGVEGLVANLMEEVEAGELQGQAERVHAGAVEAGALRKARERVRRELPGGLELLLGC